MKRTFLQILSELTCTFFVRQMETVDTLLHISRLHRVTLHLQVLDVPAHQAHPVIVHLREGLPLFQRIILRGTRGMTHTVEDNLNVTRLSHQEQRLQAKTVMIVQQDLIHLHRVWRELELPVFDLHGIDRLCGGRTLQRNEENPFPLILLTVYHTMNGTLPFICFLTTEEQSHDCHGHQTC